MGINDVDRERRKADFRVFPGFAGKRAAVARGSRWEASCARSSNPGNPAGKNNSACGSDSISPSHRERTVGLAAGAMHSDSHATCSFTRSDTRNAVAGPYRLFLPGTSFVRSARVRAGAPWGTQSSAHRPLRDSQGPEEKLRAREQNLGRQSEDRMRLRTRDCS